ncbi:VanZ family protein [Paenibacillus turpanensis]|uniref:VanZ family protein n=1 Tax=Paenibacillus turpanensis TaxID=2689078 RepID=UPI00140E5902|nr:VanZ family protein [Paenibacillus turpanensis]
MNPFDSYLQKILTEINASEEEKQQLYTEFSDHLYHLKVEYISKGYSEIESVQLAITTFGDSKEVAKNMEEVMFPNKHWLNKIAWFGLLMYIAVVLKLLIFDEIRMHIREVNQEINYLRYNLVPFESISTYLMNFHDYNFDTWFFNTFGNVLLFLPFGFLLPVLFSKTRTAIRIICLSLTFSLVIEILQLTTRFGQFDVDDLILNSIGGYIGFIIFILISKVITKLIENSRPSVA